MMRASLLGWHPVLRGCRFGVEQVYCGRRHVWSWSVSFRGVRGCRGRLGNIHGVCDLEAASFPLSLMASSRLPTSIFVLPKEQVCRPVEQVLEEKDGPSHPAARFDRIPAARPGIPTAPSPGSGLGTAHGSASLSRRVDGKPLRRAASDAADDEDVSPGLAGTLACVLHRREAAVALDEQGVAGGAEGALQRRDLSDLCLSSDGAHVGYGAAGEVAELLLLELGVFIGGGAGAWRGCLAGAMGEVGGCLEEVGCPAIDGFVRHASVCAFGHEDRKGNDYQVDVVGGGWTSGR